MFRCEVVNQVMTRFTAVRHYVLTMLTLLEPTGAYQPL